MDKPPHSIVNHKTDTDPRHSHHAGITGLYELLLRRFKTLGILVVLIPLYGVGICCFALALFPGVCLFNWCFKQLVNPSSFTLALMISFLIPAIYILFGFCLILIVPFINFLLRTNPKAWRGSYYSVQTVKWGIHNALTYIPRYIFLEYITPTPFNLLFYKLMGMKIGKGTHINTTHISDPCLIEMGDHVTIGGSAMIIAHYAQGGFLIIAPVKIGSGATIGLRATILGDVEIGDKAKILPNSFVLPKSRIPAGETWGGVPAVKIVINNKSKV